MKLNNPSQVLKGNKDFHCDITDGVLIFCQDKERAVARVFYAKNKLEAELHAFMADLILNLGKGPFQWKVVGTQELATLSQEILQNCGHKVQKVVQTESAFEVIFSPAPAKLMVARRQQDLQVSSGFPKEEKIRVLIVDDSKTIRGLLRRVFSADPLLEIVAEAELPSQVENLIIKHRPHVVTLDIHMPEMDGVTLLKRYLPKHKIPTVMISSISMEEGPIVLSALESGAVDYIQKPQFEELSAVAPLIVEKVKDAAKARVIVPEKQGSDVSLNMGKFTETGLIVIGSSTGGTEAIREVLQGLPEEIPPICIVQHIPPIFSKAFALRMDDLCPFCVKEAENGELVEANKVLIAPGGMQMALKLKGKDLRVVVEDSPPVNRHRPSVEVLFDSVPDTFYDRCTAVMLTGMGNDGAKAMKRLRDAGVYTVAQNEETCVVYGMPKSAVELGAVVKTLPLREIAHHLSIVKRSKRAG